MNLIVPVDGQQRRRQYFTRARRSRRRRLPAIDTLARTDIERQRAFAPDASCIERPATMSTEYIEFAVHLSELAATEILKYFRADFAIDNKAAAELYDPVTIADRNAEVAMRREIRRVYPQHGILGEEHGFEPGSSAYTWVLDPIDGTRSFVLGQLHWGTLIALNDGERPILGLMHQPFTRETFIGSALGGELRHEGRVQRLAARRNTRLKDVSICATH